MNDIKASIYKKLEKLGCLAFDYEELKEAEILVDSIKEDIERLEKEITKKGKHIEDGNGLPLRIHVKSELNGYFISSVKLRSERDVEELEKCFGKIVLNMVPELKKQIKVNGSAICTLKTTKDKILEAVDCSIGNNAVVTVSDKEIAEEFFPQSFGIDLLETSEIMNRYASLSGDWNVMFVGFSTINNEFMAGYKFKDNIDGNEFILYGKDYPPTIVNREGSDCVRVFAQALCLDEEDTVRYVYGIDKEEKEME